MRVKFKKGIAEGRIRSACRRIMLFVNCVVIFSVGIYCVAIQATDFEIALKKTVSEKDIQKNFVEAVSVTNPQNVVSEKEIQAKINGKNSSFNKIATITAAAAVASLRTVAELPQAVAVAVAATAAAPPPQAVAVEVAATTTVAAAAQEATQTTTATATTVPAQIVPPPGSIPAQIVPSPGSINDSVFNERCSVN